MPENQPPPPDMKADSLTLHFPTLGYFKYAHLPEHLQAVSRPFHDLAYQMAAAFDQGRPITHPEIAAGLRKLLEAKDCFVRASL